MNLNKKTKLQIFLIVFVISSIMIVPSIPNSYAHAFVVKSDPSPSQSLSSPPTKIDVYSNDPIDIKYSQLKVLDSDGKEVQINDLHYINGDQSTLSVSLPAGLKNGIYTVSTKMLDQTDGHVTENAYVFAVGQPIPQNLVNPATVSNYQAVSVPEAIARFPALLGEVIVAGAASATLWLWRPISRIPKIMEAISETRIKIDSAMIKLAIIGSFILLASGFAMIIVQAYSINAGILDAISTKFGNMWILRMVLSSALLSLSLAIFYKQKKTPTILARNQILTLLGISFSVMLTSSLISHGAATGQIIPFLFDFVHNVFSSLWIGGLIYLAFVLQPHLRKISDARLSLSMISLLIPRFSMLVITILGAVVITGPFLLYLLEGNLALTLASFYGKILIIKLSLAAAMIALGGYDHMVISRRSYLAILHTTENRSTQNIDVKPILSNFHTSVKVSAFLGMALLAAVAFLVDSGLPSSEFQNQLQSLQNNVFALTTGDYSQNLTFSQTRFVENGSRVVLSISPFATGNNDFNISFLDANKNPIDMKTVQLKLTQTDRGIGPITIDANQTSTGTFTANTDFGFAGHWTVRAEGVQNKENALNLVASYDLFVKPRLGDLQVNIQEFKTPGNNSLPLYPLYDASRNKIWTGDATIKSAKILEFDVDSGKYTEHKIDGINIATFMVLDSQDTIWYIDPISKILGHFDPSDNSNQGYQIPNQGILTSIAIDNNNTIWMTSATTNELLKFDIKTAKFDSIKMSDKSDPLDIAIDGTSGKIWVAEGIGKVASLDPTNNKIEEYAPSEKNYTLEGPSGIILDSQTGKVYVSEHEGYAVSVFDPLLKTFKRIPLDPQSLPYGMAFDKYHNLWIAQHTLDKIAILDPRTGETIEKNIPSSNSWVQWITTDLQGNIVIAEERANALGIITITAGPPQSNTQNIQPNISGIPRLGFSYAQIVAPSVTGLLIVVAFFYCKGVVDLRNSVGQIRKMQEF